MCATLRLRLQHPALRGVVPMSDMHRMRRQRVVYKRSVTVTATISKTDATTAVAVALAAAQSTVDDSLASFTTTASGHSLHAGRCKRRVGDCVQCVVRRRVRFLSLQPLRLSKL